MKTLSLSRPLLLILIGLPGSGKSFFARQFSDMFSAPVVGYDRIRYELFEKGYLESAEQDIVRRIADYQIDELVKTKRSFIIDGGSNSLQDRQKLEKLAKQHGYGTLLIWIQTDDITCKRRSTQRNKKRSPDDALSPSLTEPQLAAYAKLFAQPAKEPYMVISGKHAFSTQAKMVLRKLTAPHTEDVRTTHALTVQQRKLQPPASAPRVTAPAQRNRPATLPPRRNVVIS